MRIIIEIDERESAPDIRTTTATTERAPSRATDEASTEGVDAGPAPALSGNPEGREDPGIDPGAGGDGSVGAGGDPASDMHLDAGAAPGLDSSAADAPLPDDDIEDPSSFG